MGKMMDLNMPHELDELINCSYCFEAFNETDAVPKLLNCRHYFCLKCVNSLLHESGEEIYCLHCWKPTELPEPGRIDSLPNHNSIIFLRRNLHGLHMNAAAAAMAAAINDEAPTTSARARENGGSSLALYERQRSTSITSNGSLGALSGHSSGQLQVNIPDVAVSNVLATLSGNNNLCSNFQALLFSIGGGIGAGVGVEAASAASNNNNQLNVANFNFGERPQRNENCMTHAMPNSLWCTNCKQVLCRACATTDEHRNHTVKNPVEARDELHNDILNELHGMQRSLNELQHMVFRQRDFLLKILECSTVLKSQIETELVSNVTTFEIADIRESLAKARLCLEMLDKQTPVEAHRLHMMVEREKERLNGRYRDMFLRIKLDDLVRNCSYVFDFDDIRRTLMQMHVHFLAANGNGDVGGENAAPTQNTAQQNPVLLLTNYCIAQLYSQETNMLKQQQQLRQQKQQLCRPTGPFITNEVLSAMISNAKANVNGANNGGADVNFMHATYAEALQQNANTNGSNRASAGVDTSQQSHEQQPQPPPQQQQQLQAHIPRRTYADIANSMPSTSAAAAVQHQYQQQQLVFTQQQQICSNSDNSSGSDSSNASGYGELAPIGTPPGGCSGSVNNNHHVITTRNVAAQLFSKSDFTSLDLSLLSFQQHNTNINNNNMANHQQQLQQQQMSEPQQLLQQQQHPQPQPQPQHHPLQPQHPQQQKHPQQQQQQQLTHQRQHPQQRQHQHHNQQQHHNQHHHHHHQQSQQQKYRCEQPRTQQQHRLQIKSQKHQGSTPPVGLRLNPSQHLYPMYFFNVEINGQGAGTFIIEILNDIAPKMCKNFHALATHELGYGYKGCQIFQCWEKESIITGDFELNNGRGGRAVYEAGHFIPDETKIMAVRGCVGMRRTQKRHDNMGSVGSQFRIILREMGGFTGIFGRIVEGIDLIERIAQMGDNTGKPQSNMFITNCGKYVLT